LLDKKKELDKPVTLFYQTSSDKWSKRIALTRSRSALSLIFYFLVYLLPVGLFSWLVMGPVADQVQEKNIRAVLFIGIAILGAILWMSYKPTTGWLSSFAFSLLVYGVVFKAMTFLPDITSYPWSLGWSEGSRYYYASLFFSEKVYEQSVSPSVLHPTRYLMQSVPFLLPAPPLWLHRFWQIMVWWITSVLAGWAVARRFASGWWLALFSILFLFQGPVYYHLLVIVGFVVWGAKVKKTWLTLSVVILASIWAGISRINWYPVPGLLAALLYFIEVPFNRKSWLRYAIPPAVWTLAGTGVAFAAHLIYIRLSGNPPDQFSSSFTSDLLWYRLWPNATFGPGIVRSIWRASFPMLLVFAARWIPNWHRFHGLRIAGILAILIVLLAGGIVVSVKIGGGSNLHNLDAFLVMLLLCTAAFYTHRVVPEQGKQPMLRLRAKGALWPLVFFVLLYPIRDISLLGGALPERDFETAWREVVILKDHVEQAAQLSKEVLFIDQRHLLTTRIIENVPLVPDYEVVFLMEMVMGNNRMYLDRFEQELQDNRFAFIVSGTPRINYQDLTYAFAEENNVWVERVTVPLLCYYEVAVELPASGLSILEPREVSCK
jgi:hypothetical protein